MNAHAVAAPIPAQRPASGNLPRFAWGLLAYNVAVILWAAWCVQPVLARAAANIGRSVTAPSFSIHRRLKP